jgi:hypothetical protein
MTDQDATSGFVPIVAVNGLPLFHCNFFVSLYANPFGIIESSLLDCSV